MERYFFKKEERLCNKRLLRELFQSGSSFLLYPYRVTFLPYTGLPFPAQVVLSVPKRAIKHAVDRNKIKRRMREAYRRHKSTRLYPFLNGQEACVLLALHYVGKEAEPYAKMDARMGKAIEKLEATYAELYLGKRD